MKGRLPVLGQPDPAALKDVHLVGRYALGVDWADGHGSIYPFEHLRRLCACGACGTLTTLEPAQAWPRDIERLEGALRVTWSDGHASDFPHGELRARCGCATCTGVH